MATASRMTPAYATRTLTPSVPREHGGTCGGDLRGWQHGMTSAGTCQPPIVSTKKGHGHNHRSHVKGLAIERDTAMRHDRGAR